MSLATLKRWWKLVEDEGIEVVKVDFVVEGSVPETVIDVVIEGENPEAASDESDTAHVEPEALEAEETAPEETEAATAAPEVQNDAPKPMALSDIVKKLENLYDMLNGLYFENQLPKPIITVQSTPHAYGHCSIRKIWSSGHEGEGDARYEINIGAEYLNRPSENTAATMLHEMVHLYCRENDIRETSQGVRYHNKFFKVEMEARDLEVGYDRATPTDFEKLINRVAELEAELKTHRETEYDRLYLYDMLGYIKINSLDELKDVFIEPLGDADKIFKQEYYRRLASLQATHIKTKKSIPKKDIARQSNLTQKIPKTPQGVLYQTNSS